MGSSAWQTMPTVTWYWTVLSHNSMGSQIPSDFTIFDFMVQESTNIILMERQGYIFYFSGTTHFI